MADNRLNGLNPLAYQGVAPLSVPQLVFFNDDPTTTDSKNFSIGTIWVNRTVPESVWMLVNLAQGIATWVKFAASSGFASSFPADVGNALPDALGVLNVFGGTGINTAGAGNTLTINVDSAIAAQYDTDSGSATPAANILNVVGSHGINTTGAGNTVTALINNTITLGDLANITAGNNALTIQTGDIGIVANNGVGNLKLPDTASANAGVILLNNVRFIHGFGVSNSFFGEGSGNFTLTPATCTGNVACGDNTLNSLTTGDRNTAVGNFAMTAATTATHNVAVGSGALASLTTNGEGNSVIGFNAATNLATGNNNIIIGAVAGSAYTTNESDNIVIGNPGTITDSAAIRIGTTGLHTTAFMAGIAGVTVANNATVLIDTVTGQLGTVVSSERYKENIQDIGIESSFLYQLRPVSFNYIRQPHERVYGFLAEQVADHAPQIVLYKDGLAESVKYHELPAVIINELQNQRNIILQLLDRLEIVEKEISK